MKITLEGTAIAAAIGAADIGANEFDARSGKGKPFQNATDLFRTGVTLVSVAANYTNMETKFTDTAFYSTLPLFEKTIYRTAVGLAGGSTTVRARAASPGPARAAPGGVSGNFY